MANYVKTGPQIFQGYGDSSGSGSDLANLQILGIPALILGGIVLAAWLYSRSLKKR